MSLLRSNNLWHRLHPLSQICIFCTQYPAAASVCPLVLSGLVRRQPEPLTASSSPPIQLGQPSRVYHGTFQACAGRVGRIRSLYTPRLRVKIILFGLPLSHSAQASLHLMPSVGAAGDLADGDACWDRTRKLQRERLVTLPIRLTHRISTALCLFISHRSSRYLTSRASSAAGGVGRDGWI